MQPDEEVRVDPAQLFVGANACRDLRESLGRALADVEPETAVADKSLPGWLTQKALQEVLWWWRDDLTRLGKRLDATADALEACSRDYQATDHANASHFYHAEQPW